MRGYSISCRLLDVYLRRPYVWFLNNHSADLGKSVLSEVQQVVGGVMTPGLRLLAKSATVAAIVLLLAIVEPLVTLFMAAGIGGSCMSVFFNNTGIGS